MGDFWVRVGELAAGLITSSRTNVRDLLPRS